MYWIYLALFVLIVLTPKIIQDGVFFFREEDVESLLIFCFGLSGFILYLAKEKALLRVFKEKLNLQKRTNLITKDLSDSYSYIGGMNRKFDIVKELIFHLPKETAEALVKKEPERFQSIIQAMKLVAKTDSVSIRFVNTKTKEIEKIVGNNSKGVFAPFDAEQLLLAKKTSWEEHGCIIVRSPQKAREMAAYIIFHKVTNRVDDMEIFKILASQALLLFCVDRYGQGEEKKKTLSDKG